MKNQEIERIRTEHTLEIDHFMFMYKFNVPFEFVVVNERSTNSVCFLETCNLSRGSEIVELHQMCILSDVEQNAEKNQKKVKNTTDSQLTNQKLLRSVKVETPSKGEERIARGEKDRTQICQEGQIVDDESVKPVCMRSISLDKVDKLAIAKDQLARVSSPIIFKQPRRHANSLVYGKQGGATQRRDQ